MHGPEALESKQAEMLLLYFLSQRVRTCYETEPAVPRTSATRTRKERWPRMARTKKVKSPDRRVFVGRCKSAGCVLAFGHEGECKDGNMSEEDYEVEAIVAEKTVSKVSKYLIKWKGWPEDDNTWEEEDALSNCQEILRAWQSRRKRRKSDGKVPTQAASKGDAGTTAAVTEAGASDSTETDVPAVRDDVFQEVIEASSSAGSSPRAGNAAQDERVAAMQQLGAMRDEQRKRKAEQHEFPAGDAAGAAVSE